MKEDSVKKALDFLCNEYNFKYSRPAKNRPDDSKSQPDCDYKAAPAVIIFHFNIICK